MNAISPELLMRYADDDVSPAERRLVDEHLPADALARDLVESFREQRALLPTVMAVSEDEPGLGHCEAAINSAFAERRRRRQRAEMKRWAMPIAASLLLTLIGGLIAGHYAEQRIQTEIARLLAEQANERELALETRVEALERSLSGNTLTWTNEDSGVTGSITPLRTYRTADGQWCREYQETKTSKAADETRLGIACRNNDGRWAPPI